MLVIFEWCITRLKIIEMILFSAPAGGDAEPSVSDVTYTELELKPVNKAKTIQGRAKIEITYYISCVICTPLLIYEIM